MHLPPESASALQASHPQQHMRARPRVGLTSTHALKAYTHLVGLKQKLRKRTPRLLGCVHLAQLSSSTRLALLHHPPPSTLGSYLSARLSAKAQEGPASQPPYAKSPFLALHLLLRPHSYT